MALGSPLHGIKQSKLMGSSGQPGTCVLLPKSFHAGKLRVKEGSSSYLDLSRCLRMEIWVAPGGVPFLVLLVGTRAREQDTWVLSESGVTWWEGVCTGFSPLFSPLRGL